MRFFITEDNKRDAQLVLEAAEATKHEIHWATTLRETMSLIDTLEERGQFPDAFLCDLDLSDSTGPNTFFKLQQRVAPKPILVYTGNEDVGVARRLKGDGGATDYIAKTGRLKGAMVLAMMEIAVEQFEAAQGNRTTAALVSPARSSRDGLYRIIERAEKAKVPDEIIDQLKTEVGGLNDLVKMAIESSKANEIQDRRIAALEAADETGSYRVAQVEAEVDQNKAQIIKLSSWNDLPTEKKNDVRARHSIFGISLFTIFEIARELIPYLIG